MHVRKVDDSLTCWQRNYMFDAERCELAAWAARQIHNVELARGRGGKLARAAGTSAILVSKGALLMPVRSPDASASASTYRAALEWCSLSWACWACQEIWERPHGDML